MLYTVAINDAGAAVQYKQKADRILERMVQREQRQVGVPFIDFYYGSD